MQQDSNKNVHPRDSSNTVHRWKSNYFSTALRRKKREAETASSISVVPSASIG